MNKIKELAKKHLAVAIIMAIIACCLTVYLIKCLFVWIGHSIKQIFMHFLDVVCTVEYWELFVDFCKVSEHQIINMLVLYLALCVLYIVTILFIALGIMIFVWCIERVLYTINKFVFGKEHRKSLEYNCFILWFAKLNADITFALDWMRFDFLQIRYKTDCDKSSTEWARWLSLENMVTTIKNIFVFFFRVTGIHMLLGAVALYEYYRDDIFFAMNQINSLIIKSEITASQFVELFEVLTILCLLGYIVLDIRHKVNVYSDIRAERFKELVQMEEKLLGILKGMAYSLRKNIDIIANRKSFILQCGASSLSGKTCYIYNTKIEFETRNRYYFFNSDDAMRQFSDLDDMEDEFEKLEELDMEFKESSLNYSNIILIDRDDILTRTVYFWTPGIINIDHDKIRCFCKTSMENWYKNWFESPIVAINGKQDERYLSEDKTKDTILRASAIIDFELIRAFGLELYIKKYIGKLERRFKKLSNFSKFNLN